MSLSAKFAQLKNVSSKPANNNGPRARVQQSAASQQIKRAAQNQARRTGGPVQNVQNNKGNKGNNANKGKAGKKPILNGVKKNLRKGGKGAAGKKGGKAADKKEKKAPEDLDKDMAQYWFAAGKGPNPDVAALDADMDDYFKTKGAAAAAAATTTDETAAAPVAEAAAVMSE